MKKILFILFSGILFAACGPKQSDPAKVAWGFLHAYYTNDFEGALQYADAETRDEISETLESLQAEGVTPEEMKAAAKPVIIEIEGIIANNGYQAICAYKLRNSKEDQNALMETLLLGKTEDGWKVSF